jgi:tetratricopeptide (TPR) repeat protein
MIRKRWTSRESLLLLTILVGLVSIVELSRLIESRQPALAVIVEDEKLYLTGNAVKRMALGFNGVVADWYWMRSLQYIGRKVINSQETTQLDDLSRLNLKLLAPLLDTATTLDPQFMQPYEYAALVLPAVDVTEAIRISKKGIAANPSVWRLHQHLGYIYWQQKDFKAASETYRQGAQIPGAPAWMAAMEARMEAEGGSRDTAREIYQRMYQESDEPDVKEMAKKRLLQIQSFAERDEIRLVIEDYKKRTKRCPSTWREVADALRQKHLRLDPSGAPLDPADWPYLLIKEGCDVDLDWRSQVPGK